MSSERDFEQAKDSFLAGISALEEGRPEEAEQHLLASLQLMPGRKSTLINLSSTALLLGKIDAAIDYVEQAIVADPTDPESFDQLALLLMKRQDFAQALDALERSLKIDPNSINARYQRGYVLYQLGRAHEALDDVVFVTKTDPDHLRAWLFCGTLFISAGRDADAVQSFERALSIDPQCVEALNNLGNLFQKNGRFEDALTIYDKALGLGPSADLYLNRAVALQQLARLTEALESARQAIALSPESAEAHHCCATILTQLTRFDEAVVAYERAVALKPNYSQAYNSYGNAQKLMNRFEDALRLFDRAIALNPQFAEAHYNRGLTLSEFGRFSEAAKSFDAAFAINKDIPNLRGNRLHARLKCHDWASFKDDCADLYAAVHAGKQASVPFAFLSLSDSSQDYLRLVHNYLAGKRIKFVDGDFARKRKEPSRIRVGYLSADFRDHPVAQALAAIIEKHDRSQFEITGISTGPKDNSDLRQRIISGCDRFHDIYGKSVTEAGALLKSLELDILLVTAVHTEHSNVELFAQRYAPIQVNFLSAWSSGCEFFDYMVADPRCVTEEDRGSYSEKIVSLRGFVSDESQVIAGVRPSRQDCGLPDDAFVFCCFNDHYKINPSVFDSWMNILRSVENSVLWLKDSPSARERLRAEAAKRGIDAGRLVFAPRLASIGAHLARLHLADLTLDTLPYGGHTTMRDSLFAGVPVLTQYGKTFVGRIGASLLDDVALPELVTSSAQDYEQRAIELARDGAKLTHIRAKLKDRLASGGLFDTSAYMLDLEAAFRAMVDRHRAGAHPDHITAESLAVYRQAG